ncbi:MAG: mucoidy inhibitor MuiA family protein [Spirochaetales bacterium]|nr:mucoidy inhibitor MuiA family protein [Spirochaetales bacterium]
MKEISVSFPIFEVTVYPSAARICRKADVVIEAGESRIIASKLPGTLSPDSVRIEVPQDSGCFITGVVACPKTRVHDETHEYSKLENSIRDLVAERQKLDAEILNADREIGLFVGKAALHDQFSKERYLSINVENWKEFYPFLRSRFLENRSRARELLFRKIELEVKIDAAQKNLAAMTGAPDTSSEIEIICQTAAKKIVPIELHYLQDNVSWYPVYTISADIDEKTIAISMSAVIAQATQENWNNVSMLLSTAHPMFSCSIPVLSSKRLREQDAEVQLQKKLQPQAPPAPKMMADNLMSGVLDKEITADEVYAAEEKRGISKPGFGGGMKEKTRKKESMRSSGMQKMDVEPVMEAEEESMVNEEMDISSIGISSVPTASSGIAQTKKVFRMTVPPYIADLTRLDMERSVPVPMPSDSIKSALPEWCAEGVAPDSSLGGYDYRYPVHGLRSVASSHVPQRIPVAVKNFSMSTSYICVPSEKEAVYMSASFSNDTDTPLPAGPSQIFAGQSLLGAMRFATLGLGENGQVSLGIDRDIKVIRRENRFRRRKKLMSKDAVNEYTIEIELISYKKESIQVRVIDRFPDAGTTKEITVSDFTAQPKPKEHNNNILEWKIELLPQKKETIRFSYTVTHPEEFRLVMNEQYTAFNPQREE